MQFDYVPLPLSGQGPFCAFRSWLSVLEEHARRETQRTAELLLAAKWGDTATELVRLRNCHTAICSQCLAAEANQ